MALKHLEEADSWSLIYATWYLRISEGGTTVGVCMSIRLDFVGEGVSLSASCCHDNHESLMHPPSRLLLYLHSWGWVGNVITVPRGSEWRHHRRFWIPKSTWCEFTTHQLWPGDAQREGKPISSPLRRPTDNYQSRRGRRYKHMLMS